MKTKILFILMSFFILSIGISNAQSLNGLLNRAKKKAVRTVEKRVEKETEKAANKVMDKAIDKTKEKIAQKTTSKKQTQSSNKVKATEPKEIKEAEPVEEVASEKENKSQKALTDLYSKFTNTDDIKYENSYSFDAIAQYEIESFDEKDKSTGKVIYKVLLNSGNNNSCLIITSGQKNEEASSFLYDENNHVSIILSENDKSATVLPSQNMKTEQTNTETNTNTENNSSLSDFKKTGKSKIISGYKCYEYLAENNETEMHAWVTNDIKLNGNTAFSRLATMNSNKNNSFYPQGFMIELNTINLKNQKHTVFLVKEFNTSKKTKIDLNGYEVVKLGTNF